MKEHLPHSDTNGETTLKEAEDTTTAALGEK